MIKINEMSFYLIINKTLQELFFSIVNNNTDKLLVNT